MFIYGNNIIYKRISYDITMQTRKSARENGNRNPDKMLRNIEPGIANDCKLIWS